MSGERKIVAQEVDPAAAIVVAAGKGDINALKFLRTLGSSLAAAGSDGVTPAMAAAAKGHLAVLQFIAAESGGAAAVFGGAAARDGGGLTVAMHAARGGHADVLRWVLGNGGSLTRAECAAVPGLANLDEGVAALIVA